MVVPTKCPQCGKNDFIVSKDAHFLPKAVKIKSEQKFEVNQEGVGMFVRSFICRNCYGVVLVKEVYAKELK